MSPNIGCLLWSPADGTGFTQQDIDDAVAYLTGIQNYLFNNAKPPNQTGAGVEPTARQYGVWGAYFPGSCVVDHTNPGGNLSMNAGPGLDRIANEVTHAQQSLGLEPYAGENLIVVFTKGWTYDSNQPACAFHTNFGSGKYVAVSPVSEVCSDVDTVRGYTAHEIFERSPIPTAGAGTPIRRTSLADRAAARCVMTESACRSRSRIPFRPGST